MREDESTELERRRSKKRAKKRRRKRKAKGEKKRQSMCEGDGEDMEQVSELARQHGGKREPDHPPGGFRGTGFTAHSADLPHRPRSGLDPSQWFPLL